MKTVAEDGFLADEIEDAINAFLAADAGLHASYRELNLLAQKFLAEKEVGNRHLQGLLCASYFGRILSLYQAVYIIACRGMRSECDILLRSMTEAHFKFHYSAKSHEHASKIVLASELERLRLLKCWQRHPGNQSEEKQLEVAGLAAEIAKKIKEQEIPKITTREMAVALDREWEYDLKYALLCQPTHSDPRTFQETLHFDEAGAIKGLYWGPDSRGIPVRLATAMDMLLQAMTTEHFLCIPAESEDYKNWQSRVQSVFEKYKDQEQ
jgi:hypothetical protein